MSVPEARSPRSLANFYWQAADLVRVRSLSCTRNGRSRHFRQKNTCFGTISFRSSSGPPLAQMPPRCLPNVSQMPPRCLSDVSQMLSDASQMPPDASQMPPDASPKNFLGSRAGVINSNPFLLSHIFWGIGGNGVPITPARDPKQFFLGSIWRHLGSIWRHLRGI